METKYYERISYFTSVTIFLPNSINIINYIRKGLIMKKIMFWVSISLMILSMIGGATIPQILPVALGVFLLWESAFNSKILNDKMIALAVIMFVVNIVMDEPSTIDLVFWVAYGISGYID